jgi:cellulase/cellobiase CelA1
MVTAAILAVLAGTMTVLYLTKGDGRAPQAVAPSRSAGPTPTASTPASAGPANVHALKAGYAVRGKWKDGFNAEVTVTNLSGQPIEGWTVQLELPGTVDVTSTWGAKIDQKAGVLTMRSQAWNTYLEPGGSMRMGFEAKGAAAEPKSCRINGRPC